MSKWTEISCRELSRLIGKMTATTQVIPPGPLFFHNLQMLLSDMLNSNFQNYEAMVPLTPACMEELICWDTSMISWNGKSLLRKKTDITIDLDTSWKGWG